MTSPTGAPRREVFPPFRRSRTPFVVLIAALVVVAMLPRLIAFRADWLWFAEISYEPIFFTSLWWRIALFVAGAGVAFGFVYANGRVAMTGPVYGPSSLLVALAAMFRADVHRVLPRLLLFVSAFVGLTVGASMSSLWMTFVMAVRGTAVGTTDALFQRDLSFYLFRLPAISIVLDVLIAAATVSLFVAVPLYAMRGAFTHRERLVAVEGATARHLGALLAFLFVLIAARLWFVATANLLYSTTGPLVGASYTDVHVRLPGIRIAAVTALVAAAIVIAGITRRNLVRSAILAALLYIAVSALGRGVVPLAVQRLIVIPNELSRELPYLRHHVVATRDAWALDRVTTRDLDGDTQLSLADIRANSATIDNVRLWERELVQQTFRQLQEIRTYYDFVSVTDDRYMIDGKYRQVHLSARELNSASLPTRTFINERLTFTHGMGITMAPVNQVTPEGLPLLFIKDLPPSSSVSLTLTRPQIYYGQLTDNYVFVGGKQDEFDYPSGEANVSTRYTGKGGVPVGSLLRRALFAWRFGSLKILLSDDISGDARILYRRDIMERAQTALPFLQFDDESFLVVSDSGHLKWMLDAYTTSTHYPYAQRLGGGVNYMRNSAKIVIDAYDGTVEAYIADSTDAIIRAYDRVFPGVFMPMERMPQDLRRHVRYPGDLFLAQATLQTAYHMLEPETFYHREDQWQIPGDNAREQRTSPFMRHIILRLPGEPQPEFIYMMPFTPRGKDNLAAWMVARMDGAQYGELIVYRFPKQSLVYGPQQVSNRINQDTEISRQLTLWDQGGSEVIRGELLVIPIEESLLYVQPIFTRAEGGTIPELKRVVVAHGTRVVMSETLEGGLADLFGGTSAPRTAVAEIERPAATPALATATLSLLQQAQAHYDRAIAAQRAGNWAEYGREIEALGAVLRQLRPR